MCLNSDRSASVVGKKRLPLAPAKLIAQHPNRVIALFPSQVRSALTSGVIESILLLTSVCYGLHLPVKQVTQKQGL
ncbi:MAG TPA: hypothetical protein V6D30_20945 [Leptolyngbyaceae cyanobacterium]